MGSSLVVWVSCKRDGEGGAGVYKSTYYLCLVNEVERDGRWKMEDGKAETEDEG